jgi:excisionase family DNA binding protein
MVEEKPWRVEIRLAYDVRADSADRALGAVLPLVSLGPDRYGPQPQIADYTVREHAAAHVAVKESDDKMHGLTKAVYSADEVANILGVGRSTVYALVPCVHIGRARRYARAAILEVLEHGLERPQRPEPVRYVRPPRQTAKPPPQVERQKRKRPESASLTITEAARMLRISPAKFKQLIEDRKIFSYENYGKRSIPRKAVEMFIEGQTPRAYVEAQIAYAMSQPSWEKDRADLEPIIEKWREEWPE